MSKSADFLAFFGFFWSLITTIYHICSPVMVRVDPKKRLAEWHEPWVYPNKQTGGYLCEHVVIEDGATKTRRKSFKT